MRLSSCRLRRSIHHALEARHARYTAMQAFVRGAMGPLQLASTSRSMLLHGSRPLLTGEKEKGRKLAEASGLACGSTGTEKCLENLISIVFSRYGLKKYRQKYRHFSKCPRSAPRYVVGQNSAAPNRRKQNPMPASCAQPSTPKSKPPTSSKLIITNGFLHPRRSPTPHRRPAMHSSESTSSTESLVSTATSPQQRYCLTPLLQQWHGDEALRAPLDTTSPSFRQPRTSMALRSEVKPLSVRRPSTQKSG